MDDETTHKRRLCERLGIAITAQGLKQVDVAEACGVTSQRINNWLRGDHYPNQYFLYRFCERYPITADYLYSGSVHGIAGALGDALLAANAETSAVLTVTDHPKTGKKKT